VNGIRLFIQPPRALMIKTMIIKETSLLPGLSVTLPGLALRQDLSGNRQDFAAVLAASLGQDGTKVETELPQALQTAGLLAAPELPEQAARLLQVEDPEDEGRRLLPMDEPVIGATDPWQTAAGNVLAVMIEPDAALKQSSFDPDRLRQVTGGPVETASPTRDRLAAPAGTQQDLARHYPSAVTGVPASETKGAPAAVLAPAADAVLVTDELGTTSRIPLNSDRSGSSDPDLRNKAESAPSSNQGLQRQQAVATQDAASASWSKAARADFDAAAVPPLLAQVTAFPSERAGPPPPAADAVLVTDELGTTSRIPLNSDRSGSSDPDLRNKAESAPSSNQGLQRQQAVVTQDAASASWSKTARADFDAAAVPPLLAQATAFPSERAGPPQRFRPVDDTGTSSSSMNAVPAPGAAEPLASPVLTETASESGNLLFKTALARQSQLPVGQDYPATIASAMPLAEESDPLAAGGMSLEESLVTETAFLSGKTATEGWLKEIGLNVSGMVQGKLGRMSLQLHPEELGALEIEILTNDGTASFDFVATQAGTRELLESSLPRLRELLQQQGMQLGDAVVRDQAQQHHARDQQQSNPGRPAMPGEEPVTNPASIRQPRIDRTALIDAYA